MNVAGIILTVVGFLLILFCRALARNSLRGYDEKYERWLGPATVENRAKWYFAIGLFIALGGIASLLGILK